MDDLEKRVAELESRLTVLDTEREILRTLHQLAQSIDYGEHENWVDCFTEDGALEMVEVSGTQHTSRFRKQGRQELAEFIPGHSHAPEQFHKHLTNVPLIEVLDTGSALSTSYFARIDRGEDGPFIWSFGRYRDTFSTSADGRWRVAERRIEVESRANPPRPGDVGN